jgi:uncharacterized protein GlcG (DUF336 family)
MSALKSSLVVLGALVVGLLATFAVAQDRPGYGASVNLATAKKLAASAMAEAQKNKWNVAVAIVDNHGYLVYYEKMDDTQTASVTVAVDKARSAAIYRRPTRVFEKLVNEGKAAVLALTGMSANSGGLPIMVGGKVIGGIGVSGVTSDQDEEVAKAGLEGAK